MNTSLPPWLPLKMLHNICDIGLAPIDARFFKRLVEQSAGRPDKRPALKVFIIPRLLANEQNFSAAFSFAENRLSGVFPQIACTLQSAAALEDRAKSAARE